MEINFEFLGRRGGNESRIKILKKITPNVSCFAVDAALHRGVEKSEGGPVRARLDLFGRLLARNFSRQTRRPASWRRLRNTSNPTRTHTHTHTLTHGHCVSAKESREVGARTSFLSLLRFACSAPQIKDRIRWTSGRVSRSRIREKPPPPPEKRRKTGERHEEAGKRAKKVF